MDPLAGRTDKPDRLPRVPGSGRRWLSAGHWIAAGLLLASAAQAAEPQPANIDLFQRPAMQADLTGLERLILTGRTGHAERAIRQRLRRFASVADYHYLLAAILAATGHSDTAMESLQTAVELGFSGDMDRLADQFGDLADRADFSEHAAKAAAQRDRERKDSLSVEPAAVDGQTALATRSNSVWDPTAGVLNVAFRFDDSVPGPGNLPVRPPESGDPPLLNRLYLQGRAAGNHGDLYDNRDRDHSTLVMEQFPQLTFVEYDPAAQKARIDYGLNPGLRFNAITVGNSSSAVTGGPFWRSQPRLALTSVDGPDRLYRQYSENHLYIYPEHRDHDPEQGDLLPANTPYVLISHGSSGSDKAHLRAAVSILAAFKPAVKDFLRRNNLVMPTLQMVFRRGQKPVSGDADYLSGIAHPTVFRTANIDLPAMIETAGSLDVDTVPPMVRLEVVSETKPVPGIDIFGGGTMRLFDTPSAISRIGRSTAQRHRMRISANGTVDPNGRDLTFHWVVLRGDKDRIRIEPLDGRAGVVDLDVPWHDSYPVPGDETLTSHRVDIGVFAHNGAHYSAPAFVSFTFPANEWREYDRAGRILHVDYHGSALGKRYIDPIIFPLRDWSDRYRYDDAGRLIGWTRTRSDGSTDFTRHGARVIETDNRGRPVRAAAVRYTLEPGPGNIARVVESPTGHVLRYAYGSETDILGELEPAE